MGLYVGNYTLEKSNNQTLKRTSFGYTPKLVTETQLKQSVDSQQPTVENSSIGNGNTSITNAVNIGLGALATASLVVAGLSGKKTNILKQTINELTRQIDGLKNLTTELNTRIGECAENSKGYAEAIAASIKPETYQRSGFSGYDREWIHNINGQSYLLAMDRNFAPSNQLEQELQHTSGYLTAKTNGIKEAHKAILKQFKNSKDQPHVIRMVTSEFNKIYKTGGMGAVPRELIASEIALSNASGKNVKGIVDMPMYIGQKLEKKTCYTVEKDPNSENKFRYVKYTQDKTTNEIKPNEIVSDLTKEVKKIEMYENGNIRTHEVEIYTTDKISDPIEYKLLKQQMDELNPKLAKEIEEMSNNSTKEIGNLTFKKDESGNITVKVNYTLKLYKDSAFNMTGGSEGAYSAYARTQNNSERERFAYFSKIFYETLMDPENLKNGKRIEADTIIGNDWQTGAIGALFRLLTPIKAAQGEIPKEYKVYKDIPIQTILHNTCLSGEPLNHDETTKTLEALFGKYTSFIVRNAHMPSGCNLNGKHLNGLFYNQECDLQTMAAVYSNVLTPVSEGNANEIILDAFQPNTNKLVQLYRIRSEASNSANEWEKTIVGITNGCDKINHTLTQKTCNNIKAALKMDEDLKPRPIEDFKTKEEAFAWHQHNKGVILRHYAKEHSQGLQNNINALKLFDDPKNTSFDGVNENTTVFIMAGRISEQKGVDNLRDSLIKFCEKNSESLKGDNPPLFFIQGEGTNQAEEERIMNALVEAKNIIRQKYGNKAANRIVLSRFFRENGRYDACRLMADFTLMPSNFEPCGLVQKETQYFSGACPVVYDVGGLTSGYIKETIEDKIKNIFSAQYDFNNKTISRENFAQAMDEAYKAALQDKLADYIFAGLKLDHSWLYGKNAPTRKYDQLLHISEFAPDLQIKMAA